MNDKQRKQFLHYLDIVVENHTMTVKADRSQAKLLPTLDQRMPMLHMGQMQEAIEIRNKFLEITHTGDTHGNS